MKTGTVKFYNETKGFGFIIDDKSKTDLFVHATGLIDSIREDDRVWSLRSKKERKVRTQSM